MVVHLHSSHLLLNESQSSFDDRLRLSGFEVGVGSEQWCGTEETAQSCVASYQVCTSSS
jgi:hypothetical protein